MIIVAIVVCLVTGALAARKGYNFFLWVLAGGVVGLLILAFLPDTEKLQDTEQKVALKNGNITGGVISAIAVIGLVLRLLTL